MSEEIQVLAAKLGITEIQLAKLRVRYERKHEGRGDEKLLSWLKNRWNEVRDKRWFLARQPSSIVRDENGKPHYGYTESPSEALPGSEEGPPPNEIDQYRHSRQAKARFAQEQVEQVGNLLGACEDVRSAVGSLSPEIKASISRDLWVLKGRIDRLEQKLRRRMAA